MELPDPSIVDEFNVPQQYAVLVFDVRRAAVSLALEVRPGHLLGQMYFVHCTVNYLKISYSESGTKEWALTLKKSPSAKIQILLRPLGFSCSVLHANSYYKT